jgi:abhydrolase domain-containing protein 12
VYANKINTLFYHDINTAEQFGFSKNQVTPFNIQTPDGETLYAWHVLPIDVYTWNEDQLRLEDRLDVPAHDFTVTTAFSLLRQDPGARVIISCMPPPSFNHV